MLLFLFQMNFGIYGKTKTSVLYDKKKSIDFYWAADDPMCVVESTENTI